MLKTEEITIDGYRFVTTQFAAMPSFTLLGKLVKTVGPAIGVLSAANPDADVLALAPQIAAALNNLDPDEASVLAVQVLRGTMCITPSGNKVEFQSGVDAINTAFAGKLGMMFKVLAFAVKVNYGDFFGGSGGPAPQVPPAS